MSSRGKHPGVRATWDELLKAAATNHDVAGAVEIFQAFAASRPQPQPTPQPQKANVSNELQRQVTPGKSKAASAVPAQPRVYSSQEYEQESMKIVRMRKGGDHDGAMRLEHELHAALTEGRIRP